ncbi:hypothetical protein [Streptomyces sp. NPDC058254]|uniref:hypothetical protein n=1 Tax=Streptomyces sp. NPDC058254 TaxID=3346406 RepID=UPI0036E06B82
MSKPKYTTGEVARNVGIIAVAMMRGGQLTTRQKRILERNRDNAQVRGKTS